MEAKLKQESYDLFSSRLDNVEIADTKERAILTLPLMHVGPNKKGLFWSEAMLKKIAPLFRSIPFRYDLEGREGSSHTLNKLSSPHYDVGWTYSSSKGSWYDTKNKALYVSGEVTHPEVIAKLSRQTTDGTREVNFASMGVVVEEARCSICGSDFYDEKCENGHSRNQKYDEGVCYKVPTKISKVLHAALTNDPADGESRIEKVIIQDLGYEAAPADKREQAGEQMERTNLSNQMPEGMAPGAQQTQQPGESPSSEEILKELAERIKTIEQKISVQNGVAEETPELVNASPQDQFTQSNMGNTTQFEGQKQQEENKMDVKNGQNDNESTPVNPEKTEVQEAGDSMTQIMSMLQQILQRLPDAEVQDMGKESLDASKEDAQKSQENIPTEHQGSGDSVKDSTDESTKKNRENADKPGKVATADNSDSDSVDLKKEFADMKEQMKAMRSKLEIQDNEVPEFGGSQQSNSTDTADLDANSRVEKFGEFGAWDSIFNGEKSAMRYKR